MSDSLGLDYMLMFCLFTFQCLLIREFLFSSEVSTFDPLGINPKEASGLSSIWESFLSVLSPSLESSSGSKRDKPSSGRGVAGPVNLHTFTYVVHHV